VAQARQMWNAHGPHSYDLDLLVRADRLDDGRFSVAVRADKVASITRNGLASTGVEEGYTVPALFDLLERELELARQPESGFGAPAGYRAYLRVRFDPNLGFPTRYRRIVGGTSNGIELHVTRFVHRD
jgi:hypothetical protein